MMVIFVEFIDQLIDYPINRADLSIFTHIFAPIRVFMSMVQYSEYDNAPE